MFIFVFLVNVYLIVNAIMCLLGSLRICYQNPVTFSLQLHNLWFTLIINSVCVCKKNVSNVILDLAIEFEITNSNLQCCKWTFETLSM